MVCNVLNIDIDSGIYIITVFGLRLIKIVNGFPLSFSYALFEAFSVYAPQVFFTKSTINTNSGYIALGVHSFIANGALRNPSQWVIAFCFLLYNEPASKTAQF